jgi:TRAP-type C4-dicarboxylate transport system permease small subunit
MKTAVERLAVWTALAGGGVLVALVVLTCVSIAGRALTGVGLGPIPGDYELVEIGIGFAVFAALPWCHLNRGHATVELFAPMFGPRLNRVLDAVIDLAVLATALLLTWRLAVGMLDKKAYFETTFILEIQIWQAYALGLAGAVVFCLIALWKAGDSVWRIADGRS